MFNVPVLIHIGHPKTGSTWLREAIFYDPASGFLAPWKLEIKEGLILPGNYQFDAARSRTRELIGLDLAAYGYDCGPESS